MQQGHGAFEHPVDADLELYAVALLEGSPLAAVQAHLGVCDLCLQRLSQAAHFMWALRRALRDRALSEAIDRYRRKYFLN